MSVRVAAVLVAHQSREELLLALSSLQRHAGLPYECVVVDNASQDGTAEAVQAAFPDVAVLRNAENRGFGAACNQGFAATSAPFLLLLNPDAELRPGALPLLVACLEEHPELALVGPRTSSSDGTPQLSFGPDLTPLSERRQRRLVLGLRRRDPAVVREVEELLSGERAPDWLSGSCFLARRSALQAVGGFDEGYFLYEEDADLGLRLRRAGWRLRYTPRAEVVHRLGTSMARAGDRPRIEYHRSHLLYYRRHLGPLAVALLRLRLLAAALWEAAAGRGGLARALAGVALR